MDKKEEALNFAKSIENVSLATVEGATPHVRIMESAKVDDDFTVWFSTSANTRKISQIKNNPSACIVFHSGLSDLKINGRAQIVADKATKDRLYKEKWDKFYTNGGSNDPEYTVIKITPYSAQYRNMEKYGFELFEVL